MTFLTVYTFKKSFNNSF